MQLLRWGAILLVMIAVYVAVELFRFRSVVAIPELAAAVSVQPLPENVMTPANLELHVRMLAETIGERNTFQPKALEQSAAYIETSLQGLYPEPIRETFEANKKQVANLVFAKSGSDASLPTILIGAHYDSAIGTPGADDNASGVAGLIELARYFAKRPTRHPLRFVAFVNEEPPYFGSHLMGSYVHAQKASDRKEKIALMVALEMIGYFRDDAKQDYPSPVLHLLYPRTGNFIGIVGNEPSRRVTETFAGLMKKVSKVDVQMLVAPESMDGVDLSDHRSFWERGYPSLMVTDTAFFRNPNYHSAKDLPKTLNYAAMSNVVLALAAAIEAFDQIP